MFSSELNLFGSAMDSLGLPESLKPETDKTAALAEEREARIQLKAVPEAVKASPDTVVERIEQGFIAKAGKEADVRIRKAVIDGSETYTMTAKHRPTYQEAETEISKEMFETLWSLVSEPMLKTRYKWQGWDIDANDNGQVWAEYEMPEGQNKIQLPEGWEAAEV